MYRKMAFLIESIVRTICLHLDKWKAYRRESQKVQAAFITSFAVAVASYSLTALLLASNADGGNMAVQFSALAGLTYMVIMLFGNLRLARLLVDIMLPTRPMKILALCQAVITVVLFLMSGLRGQGKVMAVLMVSLVGVMVANFVLRITLRSVPQKRDDYALVSMLSAATQDTLDRIRASSVMKNDPRFISHMVEDASAKLGCRNTKICPLSRT